MMHFHTTSKICLDYLYSVLILDLGQTLSFGFRLSADHTTKDQHISSTNFFYESKGKLLHNYIFRPNIFSSGVRAGVCQCYRPQHHLPVCGISNSLSRDICHVFLALEKRLKYSYIQKAHESFWIPSRIDRDVVFPVGTQLKMEI